MELGQYEECGRREFEGAFLFLHRVLRVVMVPLCVYGSVCVCVCVSEEEEDLVI